MIRESKLGNYVKNQCCTQCDWVAGINQANPFMSYSVCPKCGSGLIYEVGRWEYRDPFTFLFGARTEYIRFHKKRDEKA